MHKALCTVTLMWCPSLHNPMYLPRMYLQWLLDMQLNIFSELDTSQHVVLPWQSHYTHSHREPACTPLGVRWLWQVMLPQVSQSTQHGIAYICTYCFKTHAIHEHMHKHTYVHTLLCHSLTSIAHLTLSSPQLTKTIPSHPWAPYTSIPRTPLITSHPIPHTSPLTYHPSLLSTSPHPSPPPLPLTLMSRVIVSLMAS